MKIGEFETHPAADVFPLLDGEPYRALVEDIQRNGQRLPCLLVEEDGRRWLLDGRNRARACAELGLRPLVSISDGDPFDRAWSLNAERRSLEPGHKAAIRLHWEERRGEWQRARDEAASRQRAGIPSGNVAGTPAARETRSLLAKGAGVGSRTAQKAITVHDEDPDLFEQVLRGDLSLNRAATMVSRRKAVEGIAREAQALPDGPFHVIVADPPWHYDKRKDDGTRRNRLSYATIATEEICAMPIADLCHDNSVLWLWTTNAHMPDACDVLRAWGFVFKTILTWVKPRMGTGDWLRGQTEHCLLGVRGRPTVTLTNQTTVLCAPVREHSRKPDEFFELVESLCPGSKVELFSREPRDGWKAWGAEPRTFRHRKEKLG